MNERSLAHDARRRGYAPGGSQLADLFQFCVDAFERFGRWPLTFRKLGHAVSEFFYECGDGVFVACDVAALELVRVDVPYERAQFVQVFFTRAGLVVVFYEIWKKAHENIVNVK